MRPIDKRSEQQKKIENMLHSVIVIGGIIALFFLSFVIFENTYEAKRIGDIETKTLNTLAKDVNCTKADESCISGFDGFVTYGTFKERKIGYYVSGKSVDEVIERYLKMRDRYGASPMSYLAIPPGASNDSKYADRSNPDSRSLAFQMNEKSLVARQIRSTNKRVYLLLMDSQNMNKLVSLEKKQYEQLAETLLENLK